MCGEQVNPGRPIPAIRAFAAANVCSQPCAARGIPSSFNHNAKGSNPAEAGRNNRARARGPIVFNAGEVCRPSGSWMLSRPPCAPSSSRGRCTRS